MEKERFQERLNIVIKVDENIKDELIPPMLLQPLVENSIKHGLASLVEGGEIAISIQRKNGRLAFEIADTGIGIKADHIDKLAAQLRTWQRRTRKLTADALGADQQLYSKRMSSAKAFDGHWLVCSSDNGHILEIDQN